MLKKAEAVRQNEEAKDFAINKAGLHFRGAIPNVGLGSEHPSGANISMIDGSTRFLSFSLNATVFDDLMQVNDGNVVDLP